LNLFPNLEIDEIYGVYRVLIEEYESVDNREGKKLGHIDI